MYSFVDFKSNLRTHKKMLIFILLIQIFSVNIIYFSYGLINHFSVKVNEAEGTSLHYEFEQYEEGMKVEKIQKFYSEVLPVIENKINYFYVLGFCDEKGISSSAGYKNGKYYLAENLKKMKIKGKLFSEAQLNNDEPVVMVSNDLLNDSGEIEVGDMVYKSIANFSTPDNMIIFPYKMLPEQAKIVYTSFYLKKPLLESEYNRIAMAVKRFLGHNVYFPEFDGIKNEADIRSYTGIIFVLFAMAIVCAINYCILFNYILECKRKNYAIIQTCGCNRKRAIGVYIMEMFIMLITTFITAIIIFDKVTRPISSNVFEYMDYYYGLKSYLEIGMIYLLVSMVSFYFMILRYSSKSLIKVLREG